jgi:ferrochelatase
LRAARAKRRIVIVPVAFVSEHSETLVELDIEYRHLAEANGAACYVRAPTVQVDPPFIAELARLARFANDTVEGTQSGCHIGGAPEQDCPGFNKCARRRALGS